MNHYVAGMKKISSSLMMNWELIPSDKKDKLLGQIREMSLYVLNM